ncbi:MAG: M1 family aminopeptidase [Gemmatimonadota bacterium]
MMRRTAALLLLLAAPLAAQQPRSGRIGEYTPPRDWPVRRSSFDLLHQRVDVAFDMSKRLVTGSVTTRLALSGAPSDSVRLDAGNLTIDAATDARGRKLRFKYDTSHVTVRLPRAAARGDTVEFTIRYHTIPERGIYFVPRRNVIWSQGEATETRNWIPTYDAANDKTTWEFFVTADTGMKVLSNGRLVDMKPGVRGTQVWHWAQETPASTYLYSVVAGPFTVLEDNWRGIPVEYWTYADTTAAAWRTFGETPSMIEIYSRVLGVNYPWAKYAQSIIPDFTFGGMENVSATTQTDLVLHASSGEPESGGRSLNAHELAHQWFGDLTTAADWSHIWLNEGLTTYMESVQNEKSRGWDAGQLSWWGQQQQAMQADLNLARPLVYGKYEGDDPIILFFSGHVYPKGAQVAHQLRRLLGDSLFWAGMQRFLTDNAYKPVTTADYAVAFEKVANRDLDWFFDQWAYGIGYPKVRVARRWDAGARTLAVTVDETQPVDSTHPFFRFPATIRIVTRDSVVRHEIMVTKPGETFSIPLPAEPLTFRFDEGGWLLGTVTTDQSPAELAELARHDLDFAARNWALRALQESNDSDAVAARRFILLSEADPTLRAVAAGQMTRDKTPAGMAALRSALRDPASGVRSTALLTLSRLDSNATKALARSMYESDPNDAVRTAAMAVYAPLAGAEAIPLLTEATSVGRSTNMRLTAAFQLGRTGDPRVAGALVRLTDPSEPRNLRTGALDALAQLKDSASAIGIASKGLADYDPLFAVHAAGVLGRTGGAAGRSTLQAALRKESRVTVKAAITQALAPRK